MRPTRRLSRPQPTTSRKASPRSERSIWPPTTSTPRSAGWHGGRAAWSGSCSAGAGTRKASASSTCSESSQPSRGRGLGSALLLSAFAAFATAGLREAQLGVASDNPRALDALRSGSGWRRGTAPTCSRRRSDVVSTRARGAFGRSPQRCSCCCRRPRHRPAGASRSRSRSGSRTRRRAGRCRRRFSGSRWSTAASTPTPATIRGAPNPVLTRLIANLSRGRGTTLRFGGDSADRTWWPVPGMATPPWAAYTLTPRWAAVARGLAEATGARLILGINLLADSPSIASTEAKALLGGIGRSRIAAFEIGNEPELYTTQTWYRTSGGRLGRRGARAPTTSSAIWPRCRGIRRALPRTALAGPATGSLSWLSHLPALQTGEPGLSQVTFHRYPLNRCVHNPRSPLYPSVPNLLSSRASAGLVAGMARWVALAHRRGERFRVDELNAVTCGGQPGVSDTFASALWTLDTEFWMVQSRRRRRRRPHPPRGPGESAVHVRARERPLDGVGSPAVLRAAAVRPGRTARSPSPAAHGRRIEPAAGLGDARSGRAHPRRPDQRQPHPGDDRAGPAAGPGGDRDDRAAPGAERALDREA